VFYLLIYNLLLERIAAIARHGLLLQKE